MWHAETWGDTLRHGNIADEISVKFQDDQATLHTYIAASRFFKIKTLKQFGTNGIVVNQYQLDKQVMDCSLIVK